MPRTSVGVVRATAEHEAAFTALWVRAKVEAGATADWAARTRAAVPFDAALDRADVRVYLAIDRDPATETPRRSRKAEPSEAVQTAGGSAVGFVVVMRGPSSGLVDTPAPVWIDELYVLPVARRHGVAKALLASVARYAEVAGAGQIVGALTSRERESNRFYARLGFTSATVCRSTTTAGLRRRLAGADELRHVAVVVDRTVAARRRSLRARSAALLGSPDPVSPSR